MSSSLGLLAYVLDSGEDPEITDTRVEHARLHLQNVHRSALVETRVGDRHSGLIGWQPHDDNIEWAAHLRRGNAGTSWLHIPALAGGPEASLDPWGLADDIFRDAIHPETLGAPFAVVRWSNGVLELANDILGLVRLFHYRFQGGDVWTTRQGLAHIFMGELPRRNPTAWAGMATMGWALNGTTQLGSGTQMPGGTRVTARNREGVRDVSSRNSFSDWLANTRSQPLPSLDQNIQDMKRLLSVARRWPEGAIADLSGGKDSRIIAALGISSGAIEAVRTVNTDPGEVETARQLMAAIGNPVPHRIDEKTTAAQEPGTHFLERLGSQQKAFEGRFLATTAYGSSAFSGFRVQSRPRMNGLGGEVLAGGNFATGRWRTRIAGAPLEVARDRLLSMAQVGVAKSDRAIELSSSGIEAFIERAAEMGARTAGEALDLFYCRDRMPNWSVAFGAQNTLCPLFAPSMLTRAMHSLGAPQDMDRLHGDLVRQAIPSWGQVPYYTPTFATRTSVPSWGRIEWPQVREFIGDTCGNAESFDEQDIRELLATIEHGAPGKQHEVAVSRYLWDQSFDAYVNEVRVAAQRVRRFIAEKTRREPSRV